MGSPPQVRGKQGWTSRDLSEYRITPAGAGKTFDGPCHTSKYKDHPRRCGENNTDLSLTSGRSGSPPQVRGKLWEMREKLGQDRITPAGAGKTTVTRVTACHKRDHPRRCGENCNRRLRDLLFQGSPPQVRGKQLENLIGDLQVRITPAGAGKTAFAVGYCVSVEDHPRRCGENNVPFQPHQVATGSPPQVRGKPDAFCEPIYVKRITPAGAGKTLKID